MTERIAKVGFVLALLVLVPGVQATPALPEPAPTHFYTWNPDSGRLRDWGNAADDVECFCAASNLVVFTGGGLHWVDRQSIAFRPGPTEPAVRVSVATAVGAGNIYHLAASNRTAYFDVWDEYNQTFWKVEFRDGAKAREVSVSASPGYNLLLQGELLGWASGIEPQRFDLLNLRTGQWVMQNHTIPPEFGYARPEMLLPDGVLWRGSNAPSDELHDVFYLESWNGSMASIQPPGSAFSVASDGTHLLWSNRQDVYVHRSNIWRQGLDETPAEKLGPPPRQLLQPIVAGAGEIVLADYLYSEHHGPTGGFVPANCLPLLLTSILLSLILFGRGGRRRRIRH